MPLILLSAVALDFLKNNLRWDETEKKIIFSSEKLKPEVV